MWSLGIRNQGWAFGSFPWNHLTLNFAWYFAWYVKTFPELLQLLDGSWLNGVSYSCSAPPPICQFNKYSQLGCLFRNCHPFALCHHTGFWPNLDRFGNRLKFIFLFSDGFYGLLVTHIPQLCTFNTLCMHTMHILCTRWSIPNLT